jgi:lysyl-tRNA synthetase class 2
MNDGLTVLKRRDALRKATRGFFETRGYLEVDTPVVTRCPGTEVHLQYFETSWSDHAQKKHQRWLRSSPELHMKRIMALGVEKSFQIGPCFRNHGEMSEWHNPEFTMLEWYCSGMSYHQMIKETEDYLRETADAFARLYEIKDPDLLPKKFEWIGVFDAFKSWGGIDLIDGDPELAKKAIEAGVLSVQNTDDFEIAYFKTLIEKIEPQIAKIKGCVLMDYPPSQSALAVVQNGRASRFEFYLGRVELCNGFYELTGESENRKRIGEAMALRRSHGYPDSPEDEDFYLAMKNFIKPCAGNALGFDRWLALLAGSASLDSSLLFREMK